MPKVPPQLTVQNTQFINFGSSEYWTHFQYSSLRWKSDLDTVFSEDMKSIISITTPAQINIQDCIFEHILSLSAIFYEVRAKNFLGIVSSTINLENSIFRNITSITGAGLTVLPKCNIGFTDFDISVSIVNSTFQENNADVGGAMLIYNSSISILDSTFLDNRASIIANDIYLGGASEIDQNIVNTTFNNYTESTTTSIGYDPTRFNVHLITHDSTGIKVIDSKISDPWAFYLHNVSNEEIRHSYIRLDFIDDYGNSAYDFSTAFKGAVTLDNNYRFHASTEFNALITPENETHQIISLSNLVVAGHAGDVTAIKLDYNSEHFTGTIFIKAYLRSCIPGEYNNSITCVPCPNNTISFSAQETCSECPIYAHCLDGTKICPNEGYWNARQNSTDLYECLSGRCVNHKSCIACAEGYTGPLCNACDFDDSYVENGYLKCNRCKDPHMSLIYTVIVGIGYFLYQMFSIYIIYAASGKAYKPGMEFLTRRKTERSYYIKLLLTYTQLMSILYMSSYEVYNTLGLSLQLGNPSALIMYGTQCSLIALGIKSSDFLYFQAYFQVLYPILQFAIISFFIFIAKLIKRTTNCLRIIAVTALYLLMSNQPGIVNNLGLLLSCKTLKGLGYSYIIAHPNWSCDAEEYKTFADFFVIPSLFVWSGVVPLVFLSILVINRKSFANDKRKSSLGALVSGLKSEYYFWSIVLITLKLSLSFLVFILQQNGQTKIFLSLVLLWAYQSVLRILKPYKDPSFNTFQIVMINLLMFNIIATHYLFDPINGAMITELSMIVTVIANAGFLVFMAWKILSLSYLSALAFIEKKILRRKIDRAPLMVDREASVDELLEKTIN